MFKNTFFLVRHGRTAWNEEGRFQGRTDVPLSPAGRDDAGTAGRRLAAFLARGAAVPGPTRIFTSPLSRASETARIIAVHLGIEPGLVVEDDRLAEVGFGRWEGLTTLEVKQRFPEERRARKADRFNFVPEGGGSHAELAAKMKNFIDGLHADEIPLLVTHSGNLRVMLAMIGEAGGAGDLRQAVPHDRVMRWRDGKLDEI